MIKKTLKLTTVFVIQLMIMLPLVSALQISDVNSDNVADTYATITWETDEAADSRVFYGLDKDSMSIIKTDIANIKEHSVVLSGLSPDTMYYYKVKSVNEEEAEDDNDGEGYSFQTKTSDSTALFIETDIPEYSNKARIDIIGTTKPFTRVDLFVNGVKQRSSTPDEYNDFEFLNVELSTFVTNQIRLSAADSAGNILDKTFQTVVDVVGPSVTLNDVPNTITEDFFEFKGSVSEESVVEITVNEEIVFQENVEDSFAESISLEEGSNDIKLRAIDRAGNAESVSKTIIVDTQPPVFEYVKPESGSFFYEGNAETDIRGQTEPYAEVFLYVDKDPDGDYHGKTTADAEGYFEFDDVDIEGPFFEFVGATGEIEESGYLPVSSEEVEDSSSSILDEGQEGESKQEETTVKITLVARDTIGQTVEEDLSYNIGTCYSGGMNWGIMNLIEYQSPNLLSPERLGEGTELASAVFQLDYRGMGENERIKSISFEKACKATSMLTDERYNISCQVMPTSPSISESNDKNTLHYLRYNLNKFEGLDDFYEEGSDLTEELVFPLKVKINYVHDVNGEEVEEWQTSCVDLAYAVDTSRIDPRDVLPDWLLTDGMDFMNESITNLNSMITKINVVLKYSAIACLVGFGLKTITVIYRRWQSWMDYLQDKTKSIENDDGTKCPTPRISGKMTPVSVGSSLTASTTQDDLTNTDLKERCPLAFAAWKTESTAYNAYRWACDRFLCKGTPAKWTEQATPAEVRTRIEENMWCATEVGTKGTILRKPDADECEENTGKAECWTYKDSYYTYDSRDGEWVILKRTDLTGKIPGAGVESELKVTLESGNVFLPADEKKCADTCKSEMHAERGECMTIEKAKRLIDPDSGQPDHWQGLAVGDCTEEEMCICIGKSSQGDIKNPPTDTLSDVESEGSADGAEELEEGEGTENVWDYRYEKLGYFYDKYIYHEDRDKMACFGMNNLLSSSDPYLDPSETIPAFQCLCISQIRNRLVVLRNVLQGLYNCFQQIQNTGEADAGVCKEIFTQYVCKWMYRLISYFMKGCMPWGGTGKDSEAGVGDYMQAGTQALYGGLEESTTDLMSDYDSAAVRDYIGIGEGAIANKICLGALTGDWGWDLEGFIDTAYSAPFHTSAYAFPADREYLTWNPNNDLATYEYTAAWMLTPGCDLSSYTVSLACVTDHELYNYDNVKCEQLADNPNAPPYGCDCVSASQGSLGTIDQDKQGPTKTLYTSRGITQGTFTEGSKHDTDEQSYRYDHVKITVYVKDEADAAKCIPEANRVGSRSGVFYAPISDATTYDIAACKWNIVSGVFECTGGALLWAQRGRAFFGDIKCNEGESSVDCEDKSFYLGDQLKLDEVPIFVQGKKHCLHVDVKNGHGTTIMEKDLEYNADPSDADKWVEAAQPNTILLKEGYVEESDFSKAEPSAVITPTGSGLIKDSVGTDVKYGNYSIWIKNIDVDGTEFSGEYSITEGSNWINFKKGDTVGIEGYDFEFISKPIGVPTDGTSKKYTVKITAPTRSVTSAPWHALLELRHAPELEDGGVGSCADSLEEDIVSYQGVDQKMDIPLNVVYKSESDANACLDTAGSLKNSKDCDCNGDGTISESCDGKYCYSDGKCRDYPRCSSGDTMNTAVCECDGVFDTAEDCAGKYCVEGACISEPISIDKKAPVVSDESKFVIGPITYDAAENLEYIQNSYEKDLVLEIPLKDEDGLIDSINIQLGVGEIQSINIVQDNIGKKEEKFNIIIESGNISEKMQKGQKYPLKIDVSDDSGNVGTILNKNILFY